MSTHAKLSPSSAYRWLACPGSVREEAKYPEPPSGPGAIDGTHSHTLLEHCIKGNGDPLFDGRERMAPSYFEVAKAIPMDRAEERLAMLRKGGIKELYVLCDTRVPRATEFLKALKFEPMKVYDKPIDVMVMFRMLVLQSLYNLSDEQVEYQVRDRLSFTRFLGLGIEDPAAVEGSDFEKERAFVEAVLAPEVRERLVELIGLLQAQAVAGQRQQGERAALAQQLQRGRSGGYRSVDPAPGRRARSHQCAHARHGR
mgnify:CR=1 FL=1